MRILNKDLSKNRVRLSVESPDDLWYLENIIEEDDYVSALTYRAISRETEKLRPEKKERKRMRIGIRVKEISFHEFSDMLRIKGTIEYAPEKYHITLGTYHTHNITVGDMLTIVKPWREIHLERLKDAVENSNQIEIVFVSMDYDEATIALTRAYNVQELATIYSHISGKRYRTKTNDKTRFYTELFNKLIELKPKNVVILGPGFAKEEFYGFIREKGNMWTCVVESAGNSGLNGINEILKKGTANRIIQNTRIAYETKLVDKLLNEISVDGLCVYGMNETAQALSLGAVETLLVSDKLIRKNDIDALIESAKKTHAKIVIISSRHDAGKQLMSLSGIGAILRYNPDFHK